MRFRVVSPGVGDLVNVVVTNHRYTWVPRKPVPVKIHVQGMGRMAGYTGQQVTWDQAMNSKENLMPELTSWDSPIVVPPMPRPGTTQLV